MQSVASDQGAVISAEATAKGRVAAKRAPPLRRTPALNRILPNRCSRSSARPRPLAGDSPFGARRSFLPPPERPELEPRLRCSRRRRGRGTGRPDSYRRGGGCRGWPRLGIRDVQVRPRQGQGDQSLPPGQRESPRVAQPQRAARSLHAPHALLRPIAAYSTAPLHACSAPSRPADCHFRVDRPASTALTTQRPADRHGVL